MCEAADLQMQNLKSIMERINCLYNRTPFVIDSPLLLLSRGSNTTSLWAAFFLTCFMSRPGQPCIKDHP
jgi:hypothetical protein